MNIRIREDGILEIDDARIIFRNFAGRATKFNREGERNFSVIIPNQEICNQLLDAGYNVKIKEPREAGDEPFMHLQVKVKFNYRRPNIYVVSGNNISALTEDTVDMLDEIDISSVDIDIRPSNWEFNGRTGMSAYLQAINVRQNIDRFGVRYAEDELPF